MPEDCYRRPLSASTIKVVVSYLIAYRLRPHGDTKDPAAIIIPIAIMAIRPPMGTSPAGAPDSHTNYLFASHP